MVHLLPLGIAADKSGSWVSHLLNASTVVAWALCWGLSHQQAQCISHWAAGKGEMSSAFPSPSLGARAADPLPSLCHQFLTTLLVCLALKLLNGNELMVCSLSCFLSASCERSCCWKSCFLVCGVCPALAWKWNSRAFTCVRRELRSETDGLFCPHCQRFTCLMKKETASRTVIVARSQLPGLPCCRRGRAWHGAPEPIGPGSCLPPWLL